MTRLFAIVRREFQEAMRQRWLIVTLSSVLVVIGGGCLYLLSAIDAVLRDPSSLADLRYWSDVLGTPIDDPSTQLAGVVVPFFEALVFNQLMSFTAVMAGHAGIHDRQVGTLPFLLLAPVRRSELLLGKILGSLSVPLLVYLVVGLITAAAFTQYDAATQSSAAYLPPSTGWLISFFLGAPVWSIFTGTICVIVSSMARDVRTAQQASWAVVFFATFVLSPALVGMIPLGSGIQIVFVLLGVVLSAIALAGGTWMIGRDLTR